MPRALRGRLRAFPPTPSAHPRLEGAALPRGAWCVLPEGECELSIHTDALPLAARLKRLRGSEIECSFFPDPHGARTASLPLAPSGSELARVLCVELEALDPPPRSLRVELGAAGSLSATLAPAAAPAPGWLCAYIACDADPIAFASRAARRLEAVCARLSELGLRRASLTLSTRDDAPLRASLSLARGLDPALWGRVLRALVRGHACSITLDALRATLSIAPSPRGARTVNESALCIDRAVIPERVEERLRATLEDDLGAADARTLQAWCAPLAEPVSPRCVSRWERAAGVRALPLTASWLGGVLRAAVPRAFIADAWRSQELQEFYPDAARFQRSVAPDGAATGSPQVRAWWRRTGGAPQQGGLA